MMKRMLRFLITRPGTALNRIYNMLVFKISGTTFSEFPRINGRIVIRGSGTLQIGSRAIINSNGRTNPVGMQQKTMFYAEKGASIRVGNNVGISTSLLYARNSIEIGDNVLIGGGCQVLDSDFHAINYADRSSGQDQLIRSAPIVIKEGAFIGASSIILKGVTIGKGSVVAAGSVVSRSVPDGEIWGGNPAGFIRKVN